MHVPGTSSTGTSSPSTLTMQRNNSRLNIPLRNRLRGFAPARPNRRVFIEIPEPRTTFLSPLKIPVIPAL